MSKQELHLFLWTATDPLTRRLTEEQARERFGNDAQKVEGSLEARKPVGPTNDFPGRAKKP